MRPLPPAVVAAVLAVPAPTIAGLRLLAGGTSER